MEFLKKLIDEYDPIIAWVEIPSSSRDIIYKITRRESGMIVHEPNCEASEFKAECGHIKQAKKLWENEFG